MHMCVPYLHLLKMDDRKPADLVSCLDEWRLFVRETCEYVELMHGCPMDSVHMR